MSKTFNLAAAMATVETPEAQEMTFGELLRGWCAFHKDPNDPLRLKKWIEAFGNRSAWEITSAELMTAVLAMQQSGRYKPSSINRDIASIGSAYKWIAGPDRRAAPLGFVSPTIGVKRLSEKESIRRIFIDADKLQTLLDLSLTWKDRRFAIFTHLLADTGARKSELYGRVWKDVDLDRREIILHDSKNGEPRILHFREETAALIRRICPTRPDDALMFPGKCPSEPINYRNSWAKLTHMAGLEGLHMHDMRHDRARRLLVAGTPPAVAAAVMGHSVEMLTRRYGHLAVEDARAAVERSWARAA